MPRYLYGDSAPCPLSFNFLTTLELFLAAGARTVVAEREARALEAVAQNEAMRRKLALGGLEVFHRVVMDTLRDGTTREMGDLGAEYARAVSETAVRFIDALNRTEQQRNEQAEAEAHAEADRKRLDSRTLMESFFQRATLAVLEASYVMRLSEGKEPHGEMTAFLTHPKGIVAGYQIAPGAFRDPRRVSEFARGIEVTVGSRRSWFKKAEERAVASLDDLYLGAFTLGEESAELRLRRKPDQRDVLIFHIQRHGDVLSAQAEQPDEAEAGVPVQVEPLDCLHLERLWQVLRAQATEARGKRERVLSILLDHEDVFEARKVPLLLERLVAELGPITQDIARHTPNGKELALKIESDDGQREEVYLKKDDLLHKLEALDLEDRRVFAPLGLGPPEFFLPGVIITPDPDDEDEDTKISRRV